MSARDEPRTDLHLIIKDLSCSHDQMLNVCTPADRAQIVDAILAAGYSKPRTITTIEELDALPDGTVLIDQWGEKVTRVWGGKLHVMFGTATVAPGSRYKFIPATVLYTSEAAA